MYDNLETACQRQVHISKQIHHAFGINTCHCVISHLPPPIFFFFYLEEYALLYVAANYMPFKQVAFWWNDALVLQARWWRSWKHTPFTHNTLLLAETMCCSFRMLQAAAGSATALMLSNKFSWNPGIHQGAVMRNICTGVILRPFHKTHEYSDSITYFLSHDCSTMPPPLSVHVGNVW